VFHFVKKILRFSEKVLRQHKLAFKTAVNWSAWYEAQQNLKLLPKIEGAS
jgi:hypothetical protein